jgi:putative endonuclease
MSENATKPTKPWYLYIIETKYQTWYTGITTDWQRRYEEHASNSVKSAKALKGKGPLTLIFCIQLDDHSSALKAEIWLKKQSKANKHEVVNKILKIPFHHKTVNIK